MNQTPLRPQPVLPSAPETLDEAMIERLVHAFYANIRRDHTLGPIFEELIRDNWDRHLARMCDFWSSVALTTGRYKGTPMRAHLGIPGLTQAHFAHWLELFRTTARDICDEPSAEFFIDRAERIAASLQIGIFQPKTVDLLMCKPASSADQEGRAAKHAHSRP